MTADLGFIAPDPAGADDERALMVALACAMILVALAFCSGFIAGSASTDAPRCVRALTSER